MEEFDVQELKTRSPHSEGKVIVSLNRYESGPVVETTTKNCGLTSPDFKWSSREMDDVLKIKPGCHRVSLGADLDLILNNGRDRETFSVSFWDFFVGGFPPPVMALPDFTGLRK